MPEQTQKADDNRDQGYLLHPFGVLTTSGEAEVTKAADVKKDSADPEESQ